MTRTCVRRPDAAEWNRENEVPSEALKREILLVSEPLASRRMNISRLARDLDSMFRFGMLSDICEGQDKKIQFFIGASIELLLGRTTILPRVLRNMAGADLGGE
ncbi:hypothetical protein OEA41_007508 [Lepraria neglecta]|uniref:Uncharacterized protein n=1 Tax=Lepraria neglecta TaxID=209136 RepID=A0AAD9ZFV1_9LECA|nr:hypothetical protein OEA41_007508 [Lepraria neglecta]